MLETAYAIGNKHESPEHAQTEAMPARTLLSLRNRRRLSRVFLFFGFDPRRCFRNLAGLPAFLRDLLLYWHRSSLTDLRIRLRDIFPILDERRQAAGMVGGHYFHQDLWGARKIFAQRPAAHVDVGSRIDGFVAHLLAFMPVTVIDIRSIQSELAGLTFIKDNATHLSRIGDDTIESISSLHAAEHFGLGRYSDPIQPDACFCFMQSLARVLKPGGRLYFSVPIGRERVDFNAHRVFAPATILQAFATLSLVSLSCVDDGGKLHESLDPSTLPELEYGCGLFEFTKLPPVAAG